MWTIIEENTVTLCLLSAMLERLLTEIREIEDDLIQWDVACCRNEFQVLQSTRLLNSSTNSTVASVASRTSTPTVDGR